MELDQFKANLLREREMHRRRLSSASLSRPGRKTFSPPQVKAPILFKDDLPVTKLFIYNIKDRELTKDKITELFTAQGVKGFHLDKVNTASGTAKVTCDNLETSCKLQCLALLDTFKWSYFSENKKYTGALRIRPFEVRSAGPTRRKRKITLAQPDMVDGIILKKTHSAKISAKSVNI